MLISLTTRSIVKFVNVMRRKRIHDALDLFIHGEYDRLSRGDSHDPRQDTLVERLRTLLHEHVGRDGLEPAERRLALCPRSSLNSPATSDIHAD